MRASLIHGAYRCSAEDCHFTTPHYARFIRHLEGDGCPQAAIPEPNEDGKYLCVKPGCGFLSVSPGGLLRHTTGSYCPKKPDASEPKEPVVNLSQDDEGRFLCPEEGCEFSHELPPMVHIHRSFCPRRPGAPQPNADGLFECSEDDCKFATSTLRSLHHHGKVHKAAREGTAFTCEECGFMSLSSEASILVS